MKENFLSFSDKASTLQELSKILKTATILPLVKVSYSELIENKVLLYKKISTFFQFDKIIIRSSSKAEDNNETSNAGHFKSVLNVQTNSQNEVIKAIKDVFDSYKNIVAEDIVFVQQQLTDIKFFGVAFTADLDTLIPYYIINYDISGSTDSITSGNIENHFTYIHFKNSPIKPQNKFIANLISSLEEIQKLFGNNKLDVEFAFDSQDNLYIFQVRPITTKGKLDLSNLNLDDCLEKIYKKVLKLQGNHPNLLGDKAIFGVMPDWNPAEIIGLKPKTLALSLYKELVTDNIWAYQRDNYGYRNLRSHPLMISFVGIPYVDVRVDFNSFIPKDLNENIAVKLVNYYLNKLKTSPKLHDKIEFEIVYSCYYLGLSEKLKDLQKIGFSDNEIKRLEYSLLNLTNNVINPENGLYKQDLLKISTLEENYQKIINSDLSVVDRIYWLIEDCKRFGTLPFAGIARAAFIAMQFLKSFVSTGIITSEEYSGYLASLNTITQKLNDSICKVFEEKLSKEEFFAIFGHLRPGTYDILSFRYDENFDMYFTSKPEATNKQEFSFSERQKIQIDSLLEENGLKITATQLINFIKEAIEGREYSKFVFTKSLSQILVLIEGFGKRFGFDRSELAFLDIQIIKNLYSSLDYLDVEKIFSANIKENKEHYKFTEALRLPALITEADEIYSFYISEDEPNFITQKGIISDVILENDLLENHLEGKIIFIKSADPGYDFLFSKNIGGLVTQFGGANSHMAIRCAELGIPAIIGAGDARFQQWKKAKILEIDCLNEVVRVIS